MKTMNTFKLTNMQFSILSGIKESISGRMETLNTNIKISAKILECKGLVRIEKTSNDSIWVISLTETGEHQLDVEHNVPETEEYEATLINDVEHDISKDFKWENFKR